MRRYILFRGFFSWSLRERAIHALVFLGVPLFSWQLFELWGAARNDPFFGTPALTFGLFEALLGSLLTSLIAAVIEHVIVSGLNKHQRRTGGVSSQS